MKMLSQASKAAHQAILRQKVNTQRYSQFPVHDTAFWEAVFKFAKSPKTAQDVLDEMSFIEAEPCIENQRVFMNVQAARNMAKLALLG